MAMRWDSERDDVFSCKQDGCVAARVVKEPTHWEWASYRGGWTHDHGKEPSFAAACQAAENSIQKMSKCGAETPFTKNH